MALFLYRHETKRQRISRETNLPVSVAKAEELRRRKARFAEHPASGRTWEEVKQHARTPND